jgi:hypothetical protein
MSELANYYQLKTVSVVRDRLLAKARAADNWVPNNGIDRIELDVSDFEGDPKIIALIDKFECAYRRLSIFRFLPNTCHSWHVDLQRYAAINLLLDGWNSLTMYGRRVDVINLDSVQKLVYQTDSYYLMNSKRHHAVINFDNHRYLLSIGIPEKYSFEEVLAYIQSEGT